MSEKMRLHAAHLSFGYRAKRKILDDVSLSVAPGEVLGLLGPNGTGKTTLIKCIAQLLPTAQGSVHVDGTDLADLRPAEIAKMIAYVPQYTNAAFGMTALQAVLMGRLPYAGYRYRTEDERIAFAVIERMGLSDFAFRNIQEMSGGERQRVFIARALAQETGLIILDEPTASLDLYNQLFILRLITEIAKRENLAVLMTIHDLNLASLFCDTILMLRDTHVFAHGKAQEVLTEANIAAMYGVHTRVTVEDGAKHVRLLKDGQGK